MRNWRLALIAVAALCLPWVAPAQPVPFPKEETLEYTINWPSGLDVGQARLVAGPPEEPEGNEAWLFRLHVEAAIPGYQVRGEYRSLTTSNLCTLEFRRESTRGKRRADERTTVDQEHHKAHRAAVGSDEEQVFDVPSCARDGLAYLYFLRSELAQGRIPPEGTVLYGAPYKIRFEPAGTQKVTLGGEQIDADQLIVTIEGPLSETTFVVLIARDAARTPVRITVPLEPGNFSMELVRE